MKNALIALLFSITLGIAFFSGLRYVNVLRDKQIVENEVVQVKGQLAVSQERLNQEIGLRQELAEKKSELEEALIEAEGEIGVLTSEKIKAQEHIFSLIKDMKNLRGRMFNSEQEKERIAGEKNILEEKNAQLEATLNSITELKKIIKELKSGKRKAPSVRKSFPDKQIVKDKAVEKQPAKMVYEKTVESQEGYNFGYIIKDGIATYVPQLKIEVNPAQ